jgi:lactoylglutathione lyase
MIPFFSSVAKSAKMTGQGNPGLSTRADFTDIPRWRLPCLTTFVKRQRSNREGMIMKFCWTTINVSNMEESLAFYQEIVGLPLMRKFLAGPGTEIAFLGDGETQVELIASASTQEVKIGKDISLGFIVDSLDDMLDFVQKRSIAIYSGPLQPNPRTRFFYVLDPNGLKIQFVEQKHEV